MIRRGENVKIKVCFWSELLNPKWLIPCVQKLGSYDIGLNLAVTPQRLAQTKELTKICEKQRIELNIWPLLSKRQGYWVNKWNINIQSKWFARLLNEFPTARAFILDLEKPINFQGIKGFTLKKKLENLVSDNVAREKLEKLVDLLHDHGKKVISTAYGGIPLGMSPRPSNADIYSYMVYTSFVKRVSSPDTRQNIAYYCAEKIKREHGSEKGAIDLGLTSYGIISKGLTDFLGYLDLNEILAQIRVCLYANLERIQIFSLDALPKILDSWLEKISAISPEKPPLMHNEKKGFMYRAYKKVLFSKNLSEF